MASLTYINDLDAGRQARAAALRASDTTGNPTPGRYIRDRRRAAGMTRAAVAKKISAHPGAIPQIEAALEDLERDQPGNHAPLVRSLRYHNVFPFNLAMFAGLAAATCAPSLGEWEPA